MGEGPGDSLKERRGCEGVDWSKETGEVGSRGEKYCGET